MAVQHIEIHKIAEDESALPLTDGHRQFVHAVGVTFRGHVLFHSPAIVNVMNFTDSENAHLSLRENVHQHRLRRIHGIIVPPRSPHKISRRSDERPRDHAPHTMRPIQQFPSNFAYAVKLRDWDDFFMRGDLKHTVARGIHDRLARSNVLFAQFLDDLRAGSGLVSNGSSANLLFKLLDQFLRESIFVNRERLLEPHARHFPVSCRRVFPGRARRALAERSNWRCGWRLMLQRRDVRQSEPHMIRDFLQTRFRDVAECVPADVAIFRRIRKLANSNAIQNDPENPFEFLHSPTPQAFFGGTLSHTVPMQCLRSSYDLRRWPKIGRYTVRDSLRASLRVHGAPSLLYSVTNRSLKYFPFARVVQGSGGVPWPRTAIPGEFRSFSRSFSLP